MYLGPEITVNVTGQRAMVLLSRSSLVLNTSVIVEPATLGGFPGGGGISRVSGDLLLPQAEPPEYPLWALANGTLEDGVPSYNINGPGSASYRYYLFKITTSADNVDEVQQVRNPSNTTYGLNELSSRHYCRLACVVSRRMKAMGCESGMTMCTATTCKRIDMG